MDVINKTGIYKIINKVNDNFYYGSASATFKERWRLHKKSLRGGYHPNAYLQSDWNIYGEDAFEFSIVLLCDSNNCLFYEQLFLDKYYDNGVYCYNISKAASAPMKGRKHSKQTIDKQSKVKIGQNNSMYGKNHSNDTRQKIAEMLKDKRNSPDTEFKSGNKPHNLGIPHSQETRKRISQNRTKFDKQLALIIINDLFLDISAKIISTKTGVPIKIISAIKCGNYKWANDIITELGYTEKFVELRGSINK